MVNTRKDPKSYFDIRSLIEKGKAEVREYELPIGKVLIRPLTDLEMEECEAILFNAIRDPATRSFVFKAASDDLIDLEDVNENATEAQRNIIDELSTAGDVDFVQLYQAINQMTIKIVYTSMRDFTDPFDMNDLKKIPGIKDLAHEIQRISGYTKEMKAEIEDFRQE